MITEQNNVELLSIKMKSRQHMDSELEVQSGQYSKLPRQQSSKFKAKCLNANYQDNNDVNGRANTNVQGGESHNDDYVDDDHYESSVRLLHIDKTPNGSCGFHLTRTKWDPYPWVSGVDCFTPAAQIGLQVGDCVLESLCAAPMPRSLQRLSTVVQCVLNVLECPVCLDTITPPAMQCQNGHLLCVDCRIRSESCPVCRDRYYPRPALIAEQLHAALTNAFNLCRNEDKVRQKIFGRHKRQLQMVKTTIECDAWRREVHKSMMTTPVSLLGGEERVWQKFPMQVREEEGNKINVAMETKRNTTVSRSCNKFLAKLLKFKAFSMENLTMDAATPPTMPSHMNASTTSTFALHPVLEMGESPNEEHDTQKEDSAGRKRRLNTNQFDDFIATHDGESNHLSSSMVAMPLPHHHSTSSSFSWPSPMLTNEMGHINPHRDCRKQMFSNGSRHFSLSSNDLTTNPTVTPLALTRQMSMETAKYISSPLATSTATIPSEAGNNSLPIWFRQRPNPKYNNNRMQSMATRELGATFPLEHRQIESSSGNTNKCHPHHGNTESDGSDIDADITSNFTPPNNSTQTSSTISLKSSNSSSSAVASGEDVGITRCSSSKEANA
ncbi:uncharacterized protein LOC142220753 isoform X2 [Haematobia irritans]|uniref:uncharacterized protein LOC142220753 isoform X2 n=1 Tax=Haematobia irritans TaxID=7368 RepID=UPI003F50CB07